MRNIIYSVVGAGLIFGLTGCETTRSERKQDEQSYPPVRHYMKPTRPIDPLHPNPINPDPLESDPTIREKDDVPILAAAYDENGILMRVDFDYNTIMGRLGNDKNKRLQLVGDAASDGDGEGRALFCKIYDQENNIPKKYRNNYSTLIKRDAAKHYKPNAHKHVAHKHKTAKNKLKKR